MYDVSIIDHIYNFCVEWLKCLENENIKESQAMTTRNGGLRLLERAMKSQRDENESHIPIATQKVQAVAQQKLTQLLEQE